MDIKKLFTEHPKSVNETYFQHLCFASLFGFKLIFAGLACVLHGIFPFIFKSTGSNMIIKMTNDFIQRMPALDQRLSKTHQLLNSKQQTE